MTRVTREELPALPAGSLSLYALGFAAGERAAFRERRSGKPTERATYGIPAWDRGWIEGYTPRNPAWLAGTRHKEGA